MKALFVIAALLFAWPYAGPALAQEGGECKTPTYALNLILKAGLDYTSLEGDLAQRYADALSVRAGERLKADLIFAIEYPQVGGARAVLFKDGCNTGVWEMHILTHRNMLAQAKRLSDV